MKFYKKGFTLVELLLVFFFLFLVMAALTPVVTRKHKELPDKKLHGFYACYRDENDNLRQSLIKSSKIVENNVLVDKCQFEKPKKALYYYVQIIGAGGGGSSVSLSDDNLLIQPNKSGTAGYIACGYGTSNSNSKKCSSLNWGKIKRSDFDKLQSVFIQLSGRGESGYTCSTGYKFCAEGMEPTGKFYCHASGLTTQPEGATCTGTTTYTCDVASDSTTPCEEGWEKIEAEMNTQCLNPHIGYGSTYYYSMPFEYGEKISGTQTGYNTGRVYSGGKYYSRSYSGYGVTYRWNKGSMEAVGAEGALNSLTHGAFYESNSKRCLDESVYPTIYVPSNSSCSVSTGESCSSSPSGGYDFGSINLSQYNYFQTQKLSYGIGADAGVVKTMVLKDIPDGTTMIPGAGGKVGKDGGSTTFGNHVAAGGNGSTSISYKDVSLSPVLPSGTDDTIGEYPRTGGKAIFNNFLKFVLSYKLKELRERLENIGSGGSGAAVATACTYGYDYTPLILYNGATELSRYYVGSYNVQPQELESIKCNGYSWVQSGVEGSGYWKGALSIAEQAEKGGSGAIIITW